MANLIFWNVRGIGNDASLARLKRIVKKHSVGLVALLEPFLGPESISSTVLSLGFGGGSANVSGKIWILWSKSISVHPIFDSSQLLSVACTSSYFASPI